MRASAISSPAAALWNQRETLRQLAPRFAQLQAAVNSPGELALYQWAQLAAFALEFRPDLIIELGRKNGNSTCCFLEVAQRLQPASPCRVLSLCLDQAWHSQTLPRLRPICSPEWFTRGEIRVADILQVDFPAALAAAQRCFLFWDAHGFEVAECVLGKILPSLAAKPHVVVMHDMTDARFEGCSPEYGASGLWNGESAAGRYFWLGHIISGVAQAISVLDFAGRNRLTLYSASESLHTELAADPMRREVLEDALGPLFSLQAHWFWFSLNELSGPITYPRFIGAQAQGKTSRPWRQLWHPLRDRVAPQGTYRRKGYDSIVQALRRRT